MRREGEAASEQITSIQPVRKFLSHQPDDLNLIWNSWWEERVTAKKLSINFQTHAEAHIHLQSYKLMITNKKF